MKPRILVLAVTFAALAAASTTWAYFTDRVETTHAIRAAEPADFVGLHSSGDLSDAIGENTFGRKLAPAGPTGDPAAQGTDEALTIDLGDHASWGAANRVNRVLTLHAGDLPGAGAATVTLNPTGPFVPHLTTLDGTGATTIPENDQRQIDIVVDDTAPEGVYANRELEIVLGFADGGRLRYEIPVEFEVTP